MPYNLTWTSNVSVQGSTVTWDENTQANTLTVTNVMIPANGNDTLTLQAPPTQANTLFLLRANTYDGLTIAVGAGAAQPFDGPAIVNRMALKLLGSNGITEIRVANAGQQDVWVDVAVFRDA